MIPGPLSYRDFRETGPRFQSTVWKNQEKYNNEMVTQSQKKKT